MKMLKEKRCVRVPTYISITPIFTHVSIYVVSGVCVLCMMCAHYGTHTTTTPIRTLAVIDPNRCEHWGWVGWYKRFEANQRYYNTNNYYYLCLLYTSDAADEEDSVDLGGRRIIKKKKNKLT
eukprot:TRINITY_DN10001_c0_g1_i1.p1 TRINITY_DN10001_c0_g1~~TRINITY_DN10001_c0_g1_i1.p1  ORF type:complete len:122 (+),score=8.77 TRINITY_DN10001_c0_g1_i1:332-697(+)